MTGVITPNPRVETKVSRCPTARTLLAAGWLAVSGLTLSAQEGSLGWFTDHTDIGAPRRAGTVVHDAAAGTYTIGGGGANMWFRTDSFHFVWRKVEGDMALTADLTFPGTGGNAHRKGVIMIRQTLAPDSAYADAALHGDGLTSLQFREAAGEVTHEVQAVAKAPKRLRLEKSGDYVYLSLAGDDGVLQPTGNSTRLALQGPYYIGLGVCAHDEQAFETVVFSNVAVGPSTVAATAGRSTLEYVKVPSGDRVCVHASNHLITSADWSAGGTLTFTQDAKTFRVSALGGPVEPAGTIAAPLPPAGVSPDGNWTATLEHQGEEAVLTLRPAAGGDARVLMRLPDQGRAPRTISWSPDSTKIAYIRHQPAPAAK
jgi:hypothetical protein